MSNEQKCAAAECCCKCRHFAPLGCHPWNKAIGRGSMTEIMGWACLVFLNDSEAGAGVFMDRGHGMRELFDEYKANDENKPR